MDLDFSPLADISLGAFGANVSLAKRELAGEAKLMIAIKSNAYGHGARELALAAITSGAEALAVLDIDTGVAIRQVAPGPPVLCCVAAACCMVPEINNFMRDVDLPFDGVKHVIVVCAVSWHAWHASRSSDL